MQAFLIIFLTILATTTTTAAASAASPFQYIVVENVTNWLDANSTCHLNNATLAVIQSKDQEDELKNLHLNSSYYWIDLKKNEHGVWKWASIDEAANYTNWAISHPKSTNDCGVYVAYGNRWMSTPCTPSRGSFTLQALCQMQAEEMNSTTVRSIFSVVEADLLTWLIIAVICGFFLAAIFLAIGLYCFGQRRRAMRKSQYTKLNQLQVSSYLKTHNKGRFEIKPSCIRPSAFFLGSGRFGRVYLGELVFEKHKIKVENVAIKYLPENHNAIDESRFLKEMSVMKKINEVCGQHGNLVALLACCSESSDAKQLAIVAEYCRFGPLNFFLRSLKGKSSDQIENLVQLYESDDRLQESQSLLPNEDLRLSTLHDHSNCEALRRLLLQYALQICIGMKHLTSHNFVHNNMTAGNVLVYDYYQLKIANFGLTQYNVSTDPGHRQMVTTNIEFSNIKWMPPERIENNSISTIESDVWSFGVVLWELFTLAESPYSDVDTDDLFDLLLHGLRLRQPTNVDCTQLYDEVITPCWTLDPAQRPSFDVLYDKIERLQ